MAVNDFVVLDVKNPILSEIKSEFQSINSDKVLIPVRENLFLSPVKTEPDTKDSNSSVLSGPVDANHNTVSDAQENSTEEENIVGKKTLRGNSDSGLHIKCGSFSGSQTALSIKEKREI